MGVGKKTQQEMLSCGVEKPQANQQVNIACAGSDGATKKIKAQREAKIDGQAL